MTHRAPASRARRWAALIVASLAMFQLQLVLAPSASANVCDAAFSGNPEGTLAITASVPDGGIVAPGQTVNMTITWDTGDWVDLDQFHNCFQVNGVTDDSLDYTEKPPANDGIIQDSVMIPADLVDGDEVCVRARLSGQPTGQNTSTQKSNTLCWTVGDQPEDPDVQISKSASSASVDPGDSVTFTLTAENTGPGDALDVVIEDTIAAGLTITGTSPECTVSGQDVSCDLGTVAAGAQESVTITVTATEGACPQVQNEATVRASNEPGGATGNNDSNVVQLNVVCPQPDVKIVKKSDAPSGGVVPGESFTYTISVENVGGSTATNVEVNDTIPAGLTITDVSAGCTVSGQGVSCDLGSIDAGQKEFVTITVEASEDACPEVTNDAVVTAGNEPASNTGNNSSNEVTTPVICSEPGIAVRIVKTNDADRDGDYSDDEEARRPDVDVPFLLVITNTGEAAWEITDLTDTFDGSTIDLLDAKCADLKGVVLQPGESTSCEFTLNEYSPPASDVKVNTAEVCVMEVGGTGTDCDDDPSKVRSRDVLGQTVTPTKTPPGGTAFTGSDGTLGSAAIALGLLLLGSGLLWTGNRRRERYES